MEVLLFTVRTWWSTPSTPTDGTIVGTFGYLCAPKSWSSTSPTIVLGILGKTSGDPCIITRSSDYWTVYKFFASQTLHNINFF